MGVIAKSDMQGQGTVVRVKCDKIGLLDPSRVYAMKIVSDIHETSTMSMVSTRSCKLTTMITVR